jgi:uncharacterized protein (TIGR00251 family)
MADLQLRVTPGASTDRVGPFDDDVLHVRVTRPAAEGAANRAVLRLVGKAIGVAPTRLVLVRGERSRHKRVRVEGLDAAELEERLGRIGPG